MKKNRLSPVAVFFGILLILAIVLYLAPKSNSDNAPSTEITEDAGQTKASVTVPAPSAPDPSSIPKFDASSPFVTVGSGSPAFTEEEITESSFEAYSSLDPLGRCGTAFACLGKDLMPTEERGSIGQVKPSGWQTAKYDIVDGKYLYNRCHLIGFQLSGENANERNLITGTRYLNVEGMLPFENMVADYIKETGNHVMYRVTPVYEGENLLCSGVLMEAYSVEDRGEGICFYVYCYNAQPGIDINYATGDSSLAKATPSSETGKYVLNTNSKRIHKPHCPSVSDMSPKNRQDYEGDLAPLLAQNYKKCTSCF